MAMPALLLCRSLRRWRPSWHGSLANPPVSPKKTFVTKTPRRVYYLSDPSNAHKERIISALVVNRPGTLAQIADVFGFADQNILGLCVRPTVVPELSRVTISCRLEDREIPGLKKRLKALVCVTFFHITSMKSCAQNNKLVLRSQIMVQIERNPHHPPTELQELLAAYDAEVLCQDDSDIGNDPNAPVFAHLANEPARIDGFLDDLRRGGFRIRELQTCGPLFLDTTRRSTLDTGSSRSFTRAVDAEVEKLLLVRSAQIVSTKDIQSITNASKRSSSNGDTKSMISSDDTVDADLVPQVSPMSTSQIHANADGYFSKERLRLHARIAHQLYTSQPEGVMFPKFILLIGIPGAGKSTILSHLDSLGQLTLADFVNFDVDDVIALLPEFYHAMLNIGLGNEPRVAGSPTQKQVLPGPQMRYQMCRDEAKFILNKNLYSAIMCRKNIILHGSGKSFTSYAKIIDQVKAAGFDTHVVCLDIPLEVAYDRVEKRSNGYGRDVPKSLIDLTSLLITRNFRLLTSRVPNAHLFDSNRLPPKLVWSKQRAEIVESNPANPVQRKYNL